MAKTYSIKTIFEVLDRATKPLQKVGKSFANLSKKVALMGRQLKIAGKKMSGIGKTMSTRLSLPIAALGVVALNTRKNFEQSMNKVVAVTQATGEQFSSMEKLAMKMGRTTQFTASQSAKAMSFLGMAGLETNKILEALPGTLQLAAAGGLELADAADIATNVMTSMGMEVSELTRINDVLSLAQAKANTNIYELSEAMRPVAGTASSLGISIEELTAMLGKMADAGEKGGIAGTLLRNAMLALVKPSEKTRNELDKAGINIDNFVTKEGKLKNFSVLIGELQEKNLTTGQIFKIFGERGARAILTLQKKGKNLEEFTKKLEDSEGMAKKMADQMMKGLPGAMKRLASAWEGLMLKLTGGDVGAFIEKIIGKITNLINWFTNLNPTILKIIVAIAGLAAVIGPLLIVLGGLSVALGAITLAGGLVFLAIVAIATAAFLIIKYWKPIKKFFVDLWEGLVEYAKEIGERLYKIFVEPFIKIGSMVKKIFGKLFGGTGKLDVSIKDERRKRMIESERAYSSEGFRKVVGEKSEVDVNLNLSAEPGTSAVISGVKRKKGKSKVNLKNSSKFGPVFSAEGVW